MQADFKDAALIVVGHGSTQDAESGAPIYAQAAELRRRGLFAQVREGFWGQEPKVAAVLASVKERRVFVAPLLMSEGYIGEQRIPRALGFPWPEANHSPRVQQRGDQRLYYVRPVGTHPSMTGVILSHAQQVVAQHPFPQIPTTREIALFVVGHGTPRDANSRQAIEKHVEAIRRLQIYAMVHGIYLEEDPRIRDCYALASVSNVIIVPFFISEGPHVRRDIPLGLGVLPQVVDKRLAAGQPAWRNPTERQGKRLWLADSIGHEPHLAEIILERIKETNPGYAAS